MDHITHKGLRSIGEVIEFTKEFTPIALEYTDKSTSFNEYLQNVLCMLVIGNERRDVSSELLEICEKRPHIPYVGTKQFDERIRCHWECPL
ncbi:hypothetical protein [Ekhidna sp. To15]|uniref:hypothetical protein n=1 Tax=Ekhidna sp. To15 TaxID=3395267 RepID=UPI003F524BBB